MPAGELAPFLPTVADRPLLWLFVAGHLVGDFLLQTAWMAENKRRMPVLLRHATLVTVAHLLVLAPLLSAWVALAAVGVGAAHFVIDFVKVRLTRGGPGGLGLFLGDQAAHLITLVAAASLVAAAVPPASPFPTATVAAWAASALTVGVFAFAWTGGDTIVRATLVSVSVGLEERADSGYGDEDGVPGSGRVIGLLERTIALIFIVLGQWAAIVLLVAVKSIARFEALKRRHFAEYYLIGTLTSFLVAILAGLFLAAVVFGIA
jgi:hypothetical protein